VPVVAAADVPSDGGVAVRHGALQLAVFRVGATGEWYATQNGCPHQGDMVLSRGIVGDDGGRPKVACPQHKKTFDLACGAGLSDPELRIATYPVRVEGGMVYLALPPAARREEGAESCGTECGSRA
jgi:NAD(P)H-dependent nitrite reductase small subunit